ncbi:MAG: autotransporter-associated beta strand repeat-containing protein [Pirellulales bacterium]|nr:autotransporter-associated beta strand repeat-containing protein [Pirellulales bacterium]
MIIFPTTNIVSAAVVWDGGSTIDSSLGTAENWDGDALPLTTDDVVFTGDVRTDPQTTSVSPTYNSITFDSNADAFTLGGTGVLTLDSDVEAIINNSTETQTFNAPVAFTTGPDLWANSGNIVFNGDFALGNATLYYYGETNTVTVNGTITGDHNMHVKSGTVVFTADNSSTFTGILTVNNESIVRLTVSGAAGYNDGTADTRVYIPGGSDYGGIVELTGGVTIDKRFQCQMRDGSYSDTPHVRSIGNNTLQGRIYPRTGGAYLTVESTSGLLTIESAIDQSESGVRSIQFLGEGNTVITGTMAGTATDRSWRVSKLGSGTLTYDSAGIDYFGNTGVFEGSLVLTTNASAALDDSPVIFVGDTGTLNISAVGLTLSDTQTLCGGGLVVGNVATSSGTVLSPGGTANALLSEFTDTPGTLSFNGNLTVALGASLPWDLADDNTVGSGVNDLISVTGDLALNGGTIEIAMLDGALQAGSYRLFNYTGTLSGNVSYLTVNVPGLVGSRQSAVLSQSVPNEINLDVTGGPLDLTWVGDGISNDWDLQTSANWSGGEVFYNTDSVTFDNTGSNSPDVNLMATLAPAAMTVNSTQDYTFAGFGDLEGDITVVKEGTGKWTLAYYGTNTFTGTIALSGGTMAISRDDTWTLASDLSGSGTLEVASPSGYGLLELSGDNSAFTGPVVISGGTLKVDSAADMDLSAGMPAITTSAKLQLGGSDNFTVDRVIDGTGELEKVGDNTVYVTSDILAQGTLTVTEGKLQFGVTGGQLTGKPGPGDIVTNGAVVFNSDQAYELDNTISGSGGIDFGRNASNRDLLPNAVVTLSGNNSFDGACGIYQGVVVATSSTAFGSTAGRTNIYSHNSGQAAGRLELDGSLGNLEIWENFRTSGSGSTPFRYDGPGLIRNTAGDNKINGNFELDGGAGGTLIKIAGGSLELGGSIYNIDDNTLRPLVLGGDTGTSGTVTGYIVDGTGSNRITSLEKIDPGTWTLTGYSTFTGPTEIYDGTLVLNVDTGSLGNTPVIALHSATASFNVTGISPDFYVGGTQNLIGPGTVTGNVALTSGSTISPSGVVVAALPTGDVTFNLPGGTMTINGNLDLDFGGEILQFKLTDDHTSPQNDLLQVVGNLNLDGSSTSKVLIIPYTSLESGVTYTLLNAYAENNLGYGGGFALDPNHNTRYTLTLNHTSLSGLITLDVDGSNANLTWSGSIPSWDVITTYAWDSDTEQFYQADAVLFDDTSSNTTVTLAGTLFPASITVDSSQDYTFNGDGRISSGTGITKSGTGTLTIENTGINDFNGTVTITGGTLKAGTRYALGSTVGGTLVDGGTLDVNSQNLRQEPISVQGGGAIVNNGSGSTDLYYVTLTGPATFGGNTDWNVNGPTKGSTWQSGYLAGGGNDLTKTGANEIELIDLGATSLGDVTVSEGTLTVSGSTDLGSSTLTLDGGALKLSDNTATQTKSLDVGASGGTLDNASGDSTFAGPSGTLSGTLTVLAAEGTTLTLGNALAGTGGLTKDEAGTLVLGGANTYSGDTTVSAGVLELVAGGQIGVASLIANNADLEVTSGAHTVGVIEGTGTTSVFGSASLTAASITQGSLVIGGGTVAAAASPVPEPGTWLLLLLGLFGLVGRRAYRILQ